MAVSKLGSFAAVILAATFLLAAPARADWPTHRGNAARTGNVDGQPGPQKPVVKWVHSAPLQFVASPAAAGDKVYISGLGFQTSTLVALATDPAAAKRVAWSSGVGLPRMPSVSAVALVGGQVILGDGMHQTNGAGIYCVDAATGAPAWQYDVPGTLVHIEGAPTVVGSRVYVGGGHAGVLCVDSSQLLLDGQPRTPAELKALLDKKWAELTARYEEDKKKDPDFAIAPTRDRLPKPAPKLVWQKGKDAWHVDSAVAVVGDKVLIPSAYLDLEKSGERALICVSAADGSPVWNCPLRLNPWAGVTVAGDIALVGGSSIRYEPKDIPHGKGEVVAVKLADGTIAWKKDFTGGIVSALTVQEGLVLFTATDGKLRALDLASGRLRWSYDAKAPFFAGAAVAGGTVYVADLKGVVHGVALAGGAPVFRLELSADPHKVSGMVYGSPIVHGGKLYVATCNLSGEGMASTAVVCLGDP